MNGCVSAKQSFALGSKPFGIRAGKLRRGDESGFRKVLIARRLCLAIPERFILNLARGQFADAFETQDGMAEIGYRLVTVLKIETLEKTLRVVRAHPIDRLADGICRAAVARERIGALLRRHRGYGDDSFH